MGLYADGLVDQYWNLGVTTSAGVITISCNRYLMNVDTPGVRSMQANIHHVQAQAPVRSHGIFIDRGAFARTAVGKGLPSDMQHVLQVGVDSGVLSANQPELQRWADQTLGVDCTGFASAYHFQCGMMPLGDSVNAGCGYFLRMSRQRNPQHSIVWTLDEVEADDTMLWMNERGVETKSPGHIAMIVGKNGNRLQVAESSGADDGAGHRGPRLNEKVWNGETQKADGRCLNIGEGVIIVRTMNPWYPATPSFLTTP
jgi:hypothetical protein